LRWEPFLPQALNDGAVYNFSLDAFKTGVHSHRYVNAPPGLLYPGDPGFQGTAGRDKNWWEFAPRFGFAWDVRGDGKTSVRASTGIGFEYPNLQIMSTPTSAPPFANRVVINGPVSFAILT
jgi:outer membrane receptor protein involved in Fe transport